MQNESELVENQTLSESQEGNQTSNETQLLIPLETSGIEELAECTGDQDCLWSIINSCPEEAGASWACVPTSEQIEQYQSVCPDVLSPKPSFICGCIKSKCTIYIDKETAESPRIIGDTSLDSNSLLEIVVALEELKATFDFLSLEATRLLAYYNKTGDKESAQRWSESSTLLKSGTNKINSMINTIRDKQTNFTTDDLGELKTGIKFIIGLVDEILVQAS